MHNDNFRYAHYKLDGIWCSILNRRALSSQNLPIDISLLTEKMSFGSFYGELHVPGHRASDVKTAIIERWPNLQFSAFATFELPINASLDDVKEYCLYRNVQTVPYKLFHTELIRQPLPANTEGYVFKNGNLLDWTKWKPVSTIDCVVIGIIPGLGRNYGKVGSLEAGLYINDKLISIAYVAGFTDEERSDLSKNDIGRVIEVAYQYFGSGGRLRHPRFIRFRDDKTEGECTYESQQA